MGRRLRLSTDFFLREPSPHILAQETRPLVRRFRGRLQLRFGDHIDFEGSVQNRFVCLIDLGAWMADPNAWVTLKDLLEDIFAAFEQRSKRLVRFELENSINESSYDFTASLKVMKKGIAGPLLDSLRRLFVENDILRRELDMRNFFFQNHDPAYPWKFYKLGKGEVTLKELLDPGRR